MKHENEVVDSRLMTRILCGILTAAGVWAIGTKWLGMISNHAIDWWQVTMSLGAAYGIFLFGAYALTGKLPLPTSNGKT